MEIKRMFIWLTMTAFFAGCSGTKGGNSSVFDNGDADVVAAESQEQVDETVYWEVSGSTMNYGSHTYTMTGDIGEQYAAGAKGKVTFSNVPSDLQEFRTVYEQFLGTTSYGVCAMMPMAFELWARNHSVGEESLRLICGASCYSEVMRELPRHIEFSSHSPANDPYVQRCLPAALLQGATKENGYNPIEPYTVNVVVGQPQAWGQESELLQGNVYGLNIVTENAWNTPLRTISVMQPWRGDKLFKVNSCPALYMNIYAPRQDWNGLK